MVCVDVIRRLKRPTYVAKRSVSSCNRGGISWIVFPRNGWIITNISAQTRLFRSPTRWRLDCMFYQPESTQTNLEQSTNVLHLFRSNQWQSRLQSERKEQARKLLHVLGDPTILSLLLGHTQPLMVYPISMYSVQKIKRDEMIWYRHSPSQMFFTLLDLGREGRHVAAMVQRSGPQMVWE